MNNTKSEVKEDFNTKLEEICIHGFKNKECLRGCFVRLCEKYKMQNTNRLEDKFKELCEKQGWKCYRSIPCPVCDTWQFISTLAKEVEEQTRKEVVEIAISQIRGEGETGNAGEMVSVNYVKEILSQLKQKEEGK